MRDGLRAGHCRSIHPQLTIVVSTGENTMEKLYTFQRRMHSMCHYYPREYGVAINRNAQTRKWETLTIKMDSNHKAELEALLQGTDGHIYRIDGFFTN
jgi:hypothetical protein